MITSEQISTAINKHKKELPRLQKLYRYYNGQHDILNRIIPDPLKPNNKIVTGYPSLIINTLVGYFASKPLSYLSMSNNEKLLSDLKRIFYLNDEEDVNAEIVKGFSICGKTYELFWIDENDGSVRFAEYPPTEMYVEMDKRDNIKFAIRYWDETKDDKTKVTYVEAYDNEGIYYRVSDNGGTFLPDPNEPDREHFFGETPVNIYRNNKEESGDFESYIPMIDALDKLMSDNSNEIEAWVNAYLVLAGHDATTPEDVLKLRQDGVLLVESADQAKFLTKSVNTEFQQQFFETLDTLIHDQSGTPKLTSEKFSSNLSGEALGFKLFSLETKATTKERKMEKALRKRIKFICTILNKQGADYDPFDIHFNFVRNLPQDEAKVTDQITKMVNIVDKKTLLSWHPKISDVDLVLKRLAEENDTVQLDGVKRINTKSEVS
ncbi:phage portal protein [Peribacillus sp. JNUCC 23]